MIGSFGRKGEASFSLAAGFVYVLPIAPKASGNRSRRISDAGIKAGADLSFTI
jgi:hypothetical protein